MSRFLSRKFTGQEKVELYTQSAKRKILLAKNTLTGKVIIQK